MTDTHNTSHAPNWDNVITAIEDIQYQCAILVGTFPDSLRRTGLWGALDDLVSEIDDVDRDDLLAHAEAPKDIRPFASVWADWARIDADIAENISLIHGNAYKSRPLAPVAMALVRSNQPVTTPTRISLHGQQFYDHAQDVLGTGAVELVCHWLRCSPLYAKGFLENDENLSPF